MYSIRQGKDGLRLIFGLHRVLVVAGRFRCRDSVDTVVIFGNTRPAHSDRAEGGAALLRANVRANQVRDPGILCRTFVEPAVGVEPTTSGLRNSWLVCQRVLLRSNGCFRVSGSVGCLFVWHQWVRKDADGFISRLLANRQLWIARDGGEACDTNKATPRHSRISSKGGIEMQSTEVKTDLFILTNRGKDFRVGTREEIEDTMADDLEGLNAYKVEPVDVTLDEHGFLVLQGE